MANGKITQVIGTVVDVEFPPDQLPAIYNAVAITTEAGRLILEVEEHIPNNMARCLALGPTDGRERGLEVVDTGAPITVPVGQGVHSIIPQP